MSQGTLRDRGNFGHRALRNIPQLLEVAISHGASQRTLNCLTQGYLQGRLRIRTVEEYLKQSANGIPAEFLGLPNFGKKSAQELDSLIRSTGARRTDDAYFRAQSAGSADAVSILRPLIGKSATQVFKPNSAEPPNSPKSIAELVSERLSPKQQQVLNRRFGIGSSSPATLGQLGADLSVTRERVRQIEKAALQRLGRFKNHLAPEYVSKVSATAETCIWVECDWVSIRELATRFNRLSGETILTLSVIHGSLNAWVRSLAVSLRGGWLARKIDRHVLASVSRQLQDYLRAHSLPIPLHHVAAALHCDSQTLAVAVKLAKKACLYEEFICGSSGARSRRTVQLVKYLSRQGRGVVVSVDRLRSDLVSWGSWRDLQIVLSTHKHLFLNLHEEGWATTSALSPLSQDLPVVPHPSDRSSLTSTRHENNPGSATVNEPRAGSLRSFLVRLFESEGPMALSEIRSVVEALPRSPFSASSVVPTLITHEQFIRLAPGIYWLRSEWAQCSSVNARLARLLLTDKHVTLYCQARYAGERCDLFPAWTDYIKVEWARWAYRKGRTHLLSSLLALPDRLASLAEPPEQRAWLQCVGSHPTYSLWDPISVALDGTIPTAAQILAAAVSVRHTGHISWISANRVSGNRVDDRHAVTLMALLCLFRVVSPAKHWQEKHLYNPEAAPLIEDWLNQALDCSLSLSRMSSASSFDSQTPHFASGWTAVEDLRLLLRKVSNLSTNVPDSTSDSSELDTDGLLDDLKGRLTSERLAALLEDS